MVEPLSLRVKSLPLAAVKIGKLPPLALMPHPFKSNVLASLTEIVLLIVTSFNKVKVAPLAALFHELTASLKVAYSVTVSPLVTVATPSARYS